MKRIIMPTLMSLLLVATSKAGDIPAAYAERIANAIYKAEGGAKARVPYGILSVKVSSEAEARRVCMNTIRNNHRRWERAGKPGLFLEFLARKYAPIGAANDPKGLNKHWLNNVQKLSQ